MTFPHSCAPQHSVLSAGMHHSAHMSSKLVCVAGCNKSTNIHILRGCSLCVVALPYTHVLRLQFIRTYSKYILYVTSLQHIRTYPEIVACINLTTVHTYVCTCPEIAGCVCVIAWYTGTPFLPSSTSLRTPEPLGSVQDQYRCE